MESDVHEQTELQRVEAYPFLTWDTDGRTRGRDVTLRPEAWALFLAGTDYGDAAVVTTSPSPRRPRSRKR